MKHVVRLMRTFPGYALRWMAAWVVGVVMYLLGVLVFPYAGFETLICQPPMAIVIAAISVAIVVVVGSPLQLPGVRQYWRRLWPFAAVIVVAALALLFVAPALGYTGQYVNPETGQPFVGPDLGTSLSGYFLLLFGIANWPFGR